MPTIDRDISRYTARAVAVESAHGAVSPASIVSADDLAAIDTVASLTAGIATVCFASLPTTVYQHLVEITGAMTHLRAQLDQPGQNWRDA